jgi:hypothetical protein
MKHITTLLLAVAATSVFAQSNISTPMDFYIEEEVVPAVLNVVPGTLHFVDQDHNNVIDANEACKIRFQILNSGKGDGYGCVARTTFTGNTQGIAISYAGFRLKATGSKHWVEIPITANALTQTGEIALNIVVDEPNGFGTEKIESVIGTHKLKTPFVNVVSYKVHGAASGTLERRKQFILQVIVQNTDQGTAENVRVGMNLPANVMRTGGDMENLSIASLQAGESRTLEYELIANQEAAEMMDIQIVLSEKQGKFAENATIPLQFGQHIGSSIALNVERHDHEVKIERESLTSEVDENIPVTNQKNSNTFAVIIANEDYRNVADVPFALNDGNIFREYCIKTLGIPEMHISYKPNATVNDIYSEVKWLESICNNPKYKDARIIFYYSGHGIPDMQNSTSYLLPVDGIGTDVTTGYKLDELYASLGALPAKSVTLFLDACFSGTTRKDGKEMLVAAKGVAIKAKRGVPQGNMVVFSAAQGNETAYPDYEEKHGRFTYFLLKKLQDTSGNVTLQELGDYIALEVRAKGDLVRLPQTPCVTPSASLDASWREWKLK